MHKSIRNRSNSHNKSKSAHKCIITYCDLHHCYKHSFEKLGWIILSKKNGMSEKTEMYKHNLKHLHDSICKKYEHMHDKDNKNDLLIMKENVECLIQHVNADF